ncbi:MAG: HD domain-containing protein [Firmicutes bacterium]|jgi:putative nucleotidyltransferase with HDIG domain|nr:HD domain-containing protein [Bacillota bacterium]
MIQDSNFRGRSGIITKGQTLKRLLTKSMLIVIIIPMLITYSYFIYSKVKDSSDSFDENTKKALFSIEDTICDFDREIRTTLEYLSSDIHFLEFNKYESELMGRIDRYNELYSSQDLGFGTDSGKMYASSNNILPDDFDPRLRPWYVKSVINRGEVIITSPYKGLGEDKSLYITYGVTVENDGKIIGVIGSDVMLDSVLNSLNEIQFSKSSQIYVIDENNNIILEKIEDKDFDFSDSKSYGFELINNKKSIDKIEFRGKTYRFNQSEVKKLGWKIVILNPRSVMATEFSGSIYLIVLIGFVLSLLVYKVNLSMDKALIKPIDNLILNINNIRDGKSILVSSYDDNTPVELEKIKEAIIDMDEEIRESTEILINQKQEINGQYEEINSLYEETTAMNETLNELLTELEDNYKMTVISLSNAIEANDSYTRGHCDRVRKYSVDIAKALNLTESKINTLQYCAILHDIGKVGVPSDVLNKNGKLSDEEFSIIKKHPEIGYNILKDIPFLKSSADIILQHHERIDGQGYPNGRKGDDIHLFAKIISVVDAYDAMTSSRPYRKEPLTSDKAIDQLRSNRDTQFDSKIVDIFIDIINDN